jgi:hypothetical protein
MKPWLLLLLFLLLPAAHADILDIFTGSTVYELDNVAYVENTFRPDTTQTAAGHITFWGDIVGYKNMVRVGNQDYICGPVDESVIYLYGVDHDIKGKRWFNYNVDYLRSTPTIEYNSTHVTVSIAVDLKYHHSKLTQLPNGRKKIKKTFYTEQHTFSLVDTLPAQYPAGDNVTVELHYYNNSIQPKTISGINPSDLYQKIEFKYKNESLTYRNFRYQLEYNDKLVPFCNATQHNAFDANNNKHIYAFNDAVWIPGQLNLSDLQVIAYTPYNSTDADINVTEHTDLENKIPLITILSVLLPIFCIVVIAKKV